MICRCFGHSFDTAGLARRMGQTARMMAGVPDYDAYLQHLATNHPDLPPPDRQTYFRERQAARYGAGKGGGLRCC